MMTHIGGVANKPIRFYSLSLDVKSYEPTGKLYSDCHSVYAILFTPSLSSSNRLSVFKVLNEPKLVKKNPWSESANELYRPSDRRLSSK
jgi:hypothetical protein